MWQTLAKLSCDSDFKEKHLLSITDALSKAPATQGWNEYIEIMTHKMSQAIKGAILDKVPEINYYLITAIDCFVKLIGSFIRSEHAKCLSVAISYIWQFICDKTAPCHITYAGYPVVKECIPTQVTSRSFQHSYPFDPYIDYPYPAYNYL